MSPINRRNPSTWEISSSGYTNEVVSASSNPQLKSWCHRRRVEVSHSEVLSPDDCMDDRPLSSLGLAVRVAETQSAQDGMLHKPPPFTFHSSVLVHFKSWPHMCDSRDSLYLLRLSSLGRGRARSAGFRYRPALSSHFSAIYNR